MPSETVPPESSLSAIRKIVWPPSNEIVWFMKQLAIDARDTLGYTGTDTVTKPASLEEQLSPDYSVEYEDVASLNADLFALRSLRVSLFTRRALAGEKVNQLLNHAHSRLTSPEFYPGRSRKSMTGRRESIGVPNQLPRQLKSIQVEEGFENGRLQVTASGVKNVSQYSDRLETYALRIDDGPAARVLTRQHEAIETESRRIQATKGLREGFSSRVNPLDVVIARVPGGRRYDIDRFEEVINLHPTVSFELGPVEWRLNIVSSEE